MPIKYLFLIVSDLVRLITDFAHVPLDNYVFAAARDHLGLFSDDLTPWSKIKDYSVYLNYQKELKKAVEPLNTSPLQWELSYWLAEAKKH